MGQRVILNLGQGSLQTGFPTVTAQYWEDGEAVPAQVLGNLTTSPELLALHRRWQEYYNALHENLGFRRTRKGVEIEIDESDIMQVSPEEFDALCDQLKDQFNAWLRSPAFAKVERWLCMHINTTAQLPIIIQIEDPQVRRFPWHLWTLFEDYPQAELALSTLEYGKPPTTHKRAGNAPRILAVVGNSAGIEAEQDLNLLSKEFPEAQVLPLKEPSRAKFDQSLWDEQGWDILFYAGHSSTQMSGMRGELELNQEERLSIAHLRNGLKKAIQQGLQLAIFNSCEGLGLARELEDLHIPHIIVMREPIPDPVAQIFVQYFLKALADGQSIYLAVREARERLQGLESQYPCASWLPVICQNPAVTTPWVWQRLATQPQTFFSRSPLCTLSWTNFVLATLVSAGLVLGGRQVGLLEFMELKGFDRMMQLRPLEPIDERLLIIQVTEEDVRAQPRPNSEGGSLTDPFLEQLLAKLSTYEPRVMGLDILHDRPVNPDQHTDLLQQFQQNDRFISICQIRGENDESVPPSPDLPDEGDAILNRVGFSDYLFDDDGLLRRHLVAETPNQSSKCPAVNSLSLLLALRYLKDEDATVEVSNGVLTIQGKTFDRLGNSSGGYQRLDSGGYQLHLNYRALKDFRAIAPTLTLSEALSPGGLSPDLVKDKLVLIGTVATSYKDFHPTPYDRSTPGLFIHAHMVSQILGAVSEGRPLIWSMPEGIEALLILSSAFAGGMLVRYMGWNARLAGVGIFGLAALWAAGYCSLLTGLWLPLLPCSLAALTGGTFVIKANELERRNT